VRGNNLPNIGNGKSHPCPFKVFFLVQALKNATQFILVLDLKPIAFVLNKDDNFLFLLNCGDGNGNFAFNTAVSVLAGRV
jgi:hypothetical protein